MTGQGSNQTRIAVIGAGMTGLTCARHLVEKGYHPTVFEKSRGLGGRLATRRAGDGTSFDHGAQYVTARSAAFQNALQTAKAAGAARHWRPECAEWSGSAREDWWVGAPAMNALVKPLAVGLDIRLDTEVAAIRRAGDAWQVAGPMSENGESFDIVICSVPAPQARKLLAAETEVVEALAEVSIAPCWSLMVSFAAAVDPGFDVRRSETEDLAWIACNHSKPGRDSEKACWVVHASPEWSRRHLELDRDQVAGMMVEMLAEAFEARLPEIERAVAHRWRYARTTVPLGAPYLGVADRTLFLGGDWCLGARVESAFESGRAIAQAMTAAPNRN